MYCRSETAVLQRRLASCQAILDSDLLNIVKGRSPVHLPTESMGVYEMSRVPVPIMGGAPIIDHQLVVKGTWLLHPR